MNGYSLKWDRAQCQERVCTCHDETATPYRCGCGCRAEKFWPMPTRFQDVHADDPDAIRRYTELVNREVIDALAHKRLWLFEGPFTTDFWSHRRKQPKKAKCTCLCGHTHASKTEKVRAT